MMKVLSGLSDGVKWRICNRVISDGIDPEVAADEFGLDVVVVKDVIAERETGKKPFVEKTKGGSSIDI